MSAVKHSYLHFEVSPDEATALTLGTCPACGRVKPLGVPCCCWCFNQRQDLEPFFLFDGDWCDWLAAARARNN